MADWLPNIGSSALRNRPESLHPSVRRSKIAFRCRWLVKKEPPRTVRREHAPRSRLQPLMQPRRFFPERNRGRVSGSALTGLRFQVFLKFWLDHLTARAQVK